MATKKAPTDTDHARAKLVGTLIGAVIVSLLSSGAFAKFTGDDAKNDVKEAVKGSDIGTALYLSALRDALEARFAAQDARIADLEKKLTALQAADHVPVSMPLPRLEPPPPSRLPSFEVR